MFNDRCADVRHKRTGTQVKDKGEQDPAIQI